MFEISTVIFLIKIKKKHIEIKKVAVENSERVIFNCFSMWSMLCNQSKGRKYSVISYCYCGVQSLYGLQGVALQLFKY